MYHYLDALKGHHASSVLFQGRSGSSLPRGASSSMPQSFLYTRNFMILNITLLNTVETLARPLIAMLLYRITTVCDPLLLRIKTAP